MKVVLSLTLIAVAAVAAADVTTAGSSGVSINVGGPPERAATPLARRLADDEHHEDEHHEDEHHEDEHHEDKPWGEVIIASLVINMCTLLGLLIPYNGLKTSKKFDTVFRVFIPSFAVGALLATSVFLVIPEGFGLLQGSGGHEEEGEHEEHNHRFLEEEHGEEEEHEGHEGENQAAIWKFGTCVLAGYLIPSLIGSLFPHPHVEEEPEDEEEQEEQAQEEEVGDADEHKTIHEHCDNGDCDDCDDSCHKEESNVGEENEISTKAIVIPKYDYKLISSITIGDAFHNFADGIFIGNAFLLCNRDVAIAIAASTLYHELAQEVADFLLLRQHSGLSTFQCLLLNWLSGLSILFGSILIVAVSDGISSTAIGSILSISAGVYIHIAATEVMPRLEHAARTFRERLLINLGLVLGAVPIGLVLLDHRHCD